MYRLREVTFVGDVGGFAIVVGVSNCIRGRGERKALFDLEGFRMTHFGYRGLRVDSPYALGGRMYRFGWN